MSRQNTTPVELDLDEVRTLIDALDGNVRREFERHVIPLGTRLVMVENKLIDQAANPKRVKVYGDIISRGADDQGKYAVIEVPQ
jgi:hypothetical protein